MHRYLLILQVVPLEPKTLFLPEMDYVRAVRALPPLGGTGRRTRQYGDGLAGQKLVRRTCSELARSCRSVRAPRAVGSGPADGLTRNQLQTCKVAFRALREGSGGRIRRLRSSPG